MNEKKTGRYEVYYKAAGYLSSTVVRADSKAEALAYVQKNYSNCILATHAIFCG